MPAVATRAGQGAWSRSYAPVIGAPADCPGARAQSGATRPGRAAGCRNEHTSQFFLGRQGSELLGGRGRPGRTDLGRAREAERLEDAPIAFVAVDLVALDGEPLLEIPLLERKRLLESALAEGDLVRRTPYVREPAGTFIITWRSFGFGGLAYKAANSRYLPGSANDDWCMTPMPRR